MKHRTTLAPHIFSDQPLDQIADRFARLDFAVSDLDECLFPGFTQAALTVSMFKSLLKNPHLSRDLKIKLKILDAVLFGTRVKLKGALGVPTDHIGLIKKFEKLVYDIPREYFERAAKLVPCLSYRYGPETLGLLSQMMPTGIITMSIEIIIREFMRQFIYDGTPSVTFYEANRLRFQVGDGEAFEGYSEQRFILTPDDKLRVMKDRMKQFSARCPLVIGHNVCEISMIRAAREMGGLSLGFNPDKNVENEFDIVVHARNWGPIYRFFKSLQGRTKTT
jgi:hypothetical protein